MRMLLLGICTDTMCIVLSLMILDSPTDGKEGMPGTGEGFRLCVLSSDFGRCFWVQTNFGTSDNPDYWLGALLLAFESHQKGPLERTAGLPIVIGFPESDNKITDLQINVPPAAMVAFLAGRAYRCPKCPTTKYVMDAHSGLPQVTGQASQEALQAWAAAAKHTDVEKARLAQPNLNTFLGITLQGTETLGAKALSRI